ncbi:hypothetical protein [Paenibacillus polymyxa]|uniref:hypothetical protein n=1 Tax=Paenibacillus polymyxa TaxID=1406 RepID=UPI00298C8B5E|nr:hypothetical protein [Paenibacillus polymyxa]
MSRQLGLQWPVTQADVALIRENIKHNDCYCYVLEINGVIQATVSHSKNKPLII